MPPEVKRAINEELNRQLADNVKGLSGNLTAMVLWQLHEQEGWGKRG